MHFFIGKENSWGATTFTIIHLQTDVIVHMNTTWHNIGEKLSNKIWQANLIV
jgi:hypothetical protein